MKKHKGIIITVSALLLISGSIGTWYYYSYLPQKWQAWIIANLPVDPTNTYINDIRVAIDNANRNDLKTIYTYMQPNDNSISQAQMNTALTNIGLQSYITN